MIGNTYTFGVSGPVSATPNFETYGSSSGSAAQLNLETEIMTQYDQTSTGA